MNVSSSGRVTSTALAVFVLLAGWLLVRAATYERSGWRALRPGETTVLMQAESLLADGDIAFTRLDYDRHVVTRFGVPQEIDLATGSSGKRLAFDASFVPALAVAAGLAAFGDGTAGIYGFAVSQALLLLAAVAMAAWLLWPRLGSRALWWLLALVFASVAFVYVFAAGPDLTLFAAVLVASALVSGSEPSSPRRWLIAGALVSIAVFTRLEHALVLIAFLVAMPKKERASSGFGLFAGLALGLALQGAVLWWNGGGLGLFDTSRFAFTAASGYPIVDFPPSEWTRQINTLGALHWQGARELAWGLEPKLLAWNMLYLWLGRSIGVLPYGVPILLLAINARPRRLWGWLAAVVAWSVIMVTYHGFDLYGGAGAVGNRYFLPLLAASLLVWGEIRWPDALVRRDWAPAGLATAVALVSAAFLWPSWRAPGAWPIDDDGGYGHTSTVAGALLPYEVSQQPLPGGPVLDHRGSRVRFLSEGWREQRLDVFSIDASRTHRLWLASPEPLETLILDFDQRAPSQLEVDGHAVEERVLRSDGGIGFRWPASASRRHNMWWSPNRQWVYLLDLRFPEAATQNLESSEFAVEMTLTGEVKVVSEPSRAP